MTNLATYTLSAIAVATRNGQYAGTPFTDKEGSNTYANPVLGCNKAGSNACGIGINTGDVDPTLENWSVLGSRLNGYAARTQQYSQPIGGTGLGGTYPSSGGEEGNFALTSIQLIRATDINDHVGYVVATVAAVDGAVADVASGIINATGATIAIGDRLWGPIAVA